MRMGMFVLSGVAIVLLSGCASIVSQQNYPVTLDTRPSGMQVELSNRDGEVLVRGETPVRLNLDASRGYFSSASYTFRTIGAPGGEQVMQIQGKLDGWYFGNLLFGGLIGMVIVDPITGAMYRLEKSYILDCTPASLD